MKKITILRQQEQNLWIFIYYIFTYLYSINKIVKCNNSKPPFQKIK